MVRVFYATVSFLLYCIFIWFINTFKHTHTHMYTPNHRTPSYTRTNQIVRECVIKQKVEWNKTNSFFPPETFHEWKMTHIIFSKFSMLFYFISLIVKFRSCSFSLLLYILKIHLFLLKNYIICFVDLLVSVCESELNHC